MRFFSLTSDTQTVIDILETLETYLVPSYFAVGLVVVLVLYGIYYWMKKKKRKKAWKEAADDLGMLFGGRRFFDTPRISGEIEDRKVKLWVKQETTGTGRHKRTTLYTILEVPLKADLPDGINLTYDGILSSIGEWFGDQDVKAGDEEFDRWVDVEGDDPEEIKSYLTPERRKALKLFIEKFPRGGVYRKKIYGKRKGVIDSKKQVKGVIKMGRKLAEVLEK